MCMEAESEYLLSRIFNAMNDNAKSVLVVLVKYPQDARAETVLGEASLPASMLSGVVGSISRTCHKLRFPLSQVIVSRVQVHGSERIRILKLGDAFMKFVTRWEQNGN